MFAWMLVVFGVTNIITQSQLFGPFRGHMEQFTKSLFFNCPMCVGFWVGVFWHLVGLTIVPSLPFHLSGLAAGAASSGACWIIHVILSCLRTTLM